MTGTPSLPEIQDRAAITDVLYRYAKGIDDHNPQQILACFTPDIHLEQLGRTYDGIEMVGRLFRGELGGSIRETIGVDRINTSTHVLANILIDCQGETATADTQGIAYLHCQRDGADVFLVRGVRYHDSLVRLNGRWFIRRRVHTQSWQFETVPSPLL